MVGKGEPYLLVLGQLRAEDRAIVAAAAQAMDAELKTTISAKAALEAVTTRPPLLLLVETATAGADFLCNGVRSNDRVRTTPIIGMPRELNDRTFARAFDWGVDDLVELGDWEALDRRLLSIRVLQGNASNRSTEVGEAVVADHDQARCAVLGRVLTGAGYKVRHALDPRSLQYYARQTAVKLIVANPSVGDVWNTMLSSRKENPGPAWVIAASPDEVEHWANRIGDLERVGVTNAMGPPENIVFFSNGLLSKRTQEARSAGRNLYGTTVAFRSVGAHKDDYGFTYNVSQRGIYVRSLLSLPHDDLWIDVRPPRADRYVRLLGRIAWRKALGASVGKGTPPGFAIEIVDGLARDMELWAKGCEAIEVGSRRKPISIQPGVIGLGPLETPSDETSISSRPPHDSEHPNAVSLKSQPATAADAKGSDAQPVDSGPADSGTADSGPGEDRDTAASSVGPEASTAEGRSPSLLRAKNAPSLVITILLCTVVAALVIAPAVLWALGDLRPVPVVHSGPRKTVERTALKTASSPQPATPQPSQLQPNQLPTHSPAVPSAAPGEALPAASAPPSGATGSSGPPQAPPVDKRDPAPATSGSTAAQAPATMPAAPVQSSDVDLDILPAEHGFLRVLSPVRARVLVQGQDVGETNSWRIVKCGRRLVRLGDGKGGFLEPGSTVLVQCRGATTVQILPKPAVDTAPRSR